MNTAYIYVNIVAFLCYAMMFIAFFAAERSREMKAWILLLFDLTIWSAGSLFMRLDIYPNYQLWYYVSLLALFSIAFLVYNYVYQVANVHNTTLRHIWLVGTLIILGVSLTGCFLAPPEEVVNELGNKVFVYATDYMIIIPSAFFLCIVVSIIKLFRKILHEKGTKAPGVKELIIGCFLLALGNFVQILPGNTFPWDTLCGVLFVFLISASLQKRRMFNASLLISSSILVIASAVMCVTVAALFFPKVSEFCANNLASIAPAETEAFVLLAIILFAAIYAFRKLLNVVFREQEQQNGKLKKYSDIVSRTLSVDDILKETIKVIRSEIKVNQMFVCLNEGGKFVPMRSAMPLKPLKFTLSADNPCVKYLEFGENHLVLKEFEANPLYKSIWKREREIFAENEIVSICALKDNEQIIGLLLLTEKEKGASYSYSDFAFLNTVCSVASLALKNARLYEHVAERENLFSSMTAFIPNVILIKKKNEPNFCFISANTERVLGLPYEFFSNQTTTETLIKCLGKEKAEEIVSTFKHAPSGGYVCDIPFIKPDDNIEHTIRCAFSPIEFDGLISHYVCVLSDISTDIEAKELLKSAVEIAQNSSKAKSDFLSHMSHEVRTPMNSIAGLTYLAREHVRNSDDKELTEFIDQIDQSSQYLLSLLNNIMDMSKIENQLYEIKKQPFDVKKVVDEVHSVYSAQMQAKNITLYFNHDSIMHNMLIGDEIALKKILNNLLSNAYKYTDENGRVELYAKQRMMSPNSTVMHFEISDNGKGMSEEFTKKIFEPYTQELTRGVSGETGSGLGMAICKNIVDLQGGQISVSSEIGVGTNFTVDIPYSISSAEEPEKDENVDELSALDGKRIMIVDDVMINTVITQKLLEKHGVKVDCVQNGKQAVELFESKSDFYYDCILMDIQMPVMDGFEAAAVIRSKKKRYAAMVPIVAMTADAFISDSDITSRNNFDEYIIKPISPNELYGKLVKLFKERD